MTMGTTVKKNRSVKNAVDARALKKAIEKDKYQMPNLNNLMGLIFPLDLETARCFNLQIVGGKSTGTY